MVRHTSKKKKKKKPHRCRDASGPENQTQMRVSVPLTRAPKGAAHVMWPHFVQTDEEEAHRSGIASFEADRVLAPRRPVWSPLELPGGPWEPSRLGCLPSM